MATKTPVRPVHHDDEPLVGIPPEPPVRKRRSYAWVWLLVLAVAGYFGYRYYQRTHVQSTAATAAQGRNAKPRVIPVVTAPARAGDMPVFLRGLGTVTPLNNVTVKSRVDGQLMAIHFTEGQHVNQGDLLAEIDPRPFEVQLAQAQGQLARDQAQLNDAQANLGRYQALWKEQVIARQQLDTQQATVGQFQGVLETDRAAIASARLQLTYAKITAPISGRVGLRQVDAGNIVRAADASGLVTIAQMHPIAVLFTIPADNLPQVLAKLRVGAKLRVDAYDRDDKTKIASGTLLTVDNQIDPTTGTSKLKAVFNNDNNVLFPNQFVNCHLLLDTRHNVVIIPAPAIQTGPQGSFVFVVAGGHATMRPVTVSMTEGGDVAAEGIQPGDLVVTDGQDKLQDGSSVESRRPGGAGGARGAGAAAGTGAGAAAGSRRHAK